MELVTISLDKIKPYERNPRNNNKAVDAVMESIRQCTYVAPIIVDENNVILAGHTRYKALKKLGKTEAEVIVKSGLSDEQKRKYRLLDNKTNELAEWDFEMLAEELEGLDFEEFDFGFDDLSDYINAPSVKAVNTVPYRKCHFLVTCDINMADVVMNKIEEFKTIEGVTIYSTFN